MVGERETREAQPGRFGDEFFGVARSVEEAESRVRVKFGVDRHRSQIPAVRH